MINRHRSRPHSFVVILTGVLCAMFAAVCAGAAEAQTPRPAAQVAQAAQAAQNDTWTRAVAFYRSQLEQHGIVGSSLLVMKDGAIAGEAVEGLMDRDAKRAVDRDTIFHWASITKTFTAIAIMQLRDRGLLTLDDPIVKYVPELEKVHNPFGKMSAITIRHLLSHSSGFRNGTWPYGGDKDWHPFEPPTWKQLDAMMPYTEMVFAPGSKYSYSNPGMVYLGMTIERLTNEDYEMYVTKNVLSPLGMSRAFFDRAPVHLLKDRSHSYTLTDDGLKEARFDFDTGITVSNGGLNAPLSDMSKYLAFLMGSKDPKQQAGFDVVLKRASLEEMFKPVIAGSEPDVSLGLGYFLEKHRGLDLVGHSGSQNGFLSHFYVHLPTRTAFIVAYNTDASSKAKGDKQNTRALDRAIRDHLVEHVFPALATRTGTTTSASR
jgi:CubicO group peptidase (beta-lactamase class C family)